MSEIIRVEKFKYCGKEYNRLTEIQQAVENKLGRIIDAIDVTLTPMQKLAILRALVNNKEALVPLLTVTYSIETENALHDESRNILDL